MSARSFWRTLLEAQKLLVIFRRREARNPFDLTVSFWVCQKPKEKCTRHKRGDKYLLRATRHFQSMQTWSWNLDWIKINQKCQKLQVGSSREILACWQSEEGNLFLPAHKAEREICSQQHWKCSFSTNTFFISAFTKASQTWEQKSSMCEYSTFSKELLCELLQNNSCLTDKLD